MVDRPMRGGAFTRSLVRIAAQTEAGAMSVRRGLREDVRAARAKEQRETEEAFAYLEGLAELDELDRAAFDSALERKVEDEELPS